MTLEDLGSKILGYRFWVKIWWKGINMLVVMFERKHIGAKTILW